MILAAANVVGGFVVTDRMLEMFKKREPPKPTGRATPVSHERLSNLLYLVTIICFVLALRFLSSPTTARRGNWIGAAGMAVAIGVTLAQHERAHRLADHRRRRDRRRLRSGRRAQGEDDRDAADGGAVQRRRRRRGGARLARRVPHLRARARALHVDVALAIVLSALIGSVSFAGSLVAFAKLQELIGGRPITYPRPAVRQRRPVCGRRRRRGDRDRRRRRAAVAARSCSSPARSSSASCSSCRSAAPTCRS